MSAAVITDYKYYKIPNILNIWGLITFLLLDVLLQSNGYFYTSIMGMLVPILILFPVFMIGGIGAGDIKMLCVIGGTLGTYCIIKFTIISFLIAGTFGLIKLLFKFSIDILRKNRSYKFGVKMHFSYAVYATVVLEPVLGLMDR